MNYFMFFLIMLVLGVIAVASNPSPYFAALGLVFAAASGCGLLAGYGGSFVSLILFLIYLGGMLVVFAYCAALVAEPYPEGWSTLSVLGRVGGCFLLCFIGFYVGGVDFGYYCGVMDEGNSFSELHGDFSGISLMYGSGGVMLLICGWMLLLTLFVILELTRGFSRGVLRNV
uniref:NADH dehydrogenase subunit 6 n=1 Tax=Uroconger lepturus TaxID=189925 RepID=UPI0028FCB2C5|nr:NADH dehydrogenase subunit 6 [Uroconger lepturus]WNH38067.1 NADH dehydrogenase subunit 6 [Uroconger lepturus]